MKKIVPRQQLWSMVLVPLILVTVFFIGSFFQNNDANYSKGVLALNTDASSYATAAGVLLQMSALDANGDTLCSSRLELEIDTPGAWRNTVISTAQGQIQQSPSCSPENNVTNEPDYLARYVVQEPGLYQLKLKNLDTGKTVKSSFEVTPSANPIQLTRTSATRINPFKSSRYPMVLRVTAREQFSGQLIESVPKDFAFQWIGQAKQSQTSDSQVLK